MPTRTLPVTQMTEQELLDCVIETAHLFGWKCAHFRAAMTKHGWRTPVSADGKGFVDLVLVRDRLVAIELKSTKGTMSEDQVRWHGALVGAGVEVYVFRPSDWADGTIERVLRRRV
jgi:hypothetical protein